MYVCLRNEKPMLMYGSARVEHLSFPPHSCKSKHLGQTEATFEAGLLLPYLALEILDVFLWSESRRISQSPTRPQLMNIIK